MKYLLLLVLIASSLARAAECELAREESAWIDRAVSAWEKARQSLDLAPEETRTKFVFFDGECAWRGDDPAHLVGEVHAGQVALPDGNSIAPQIASFATAHDDGRQMFMVMALPEIWSAGGVQSELGLETLMVAVFVHEMTHTRQFGAIGSKIDALVERWKLDDSLNDDIVQDHYQDVAAFVADIDVERDLLFRAAAAATEREARELARQALERLAARRNKFYVGDDEKFAELEDVFLTMEGVAQWAAFRWVTDPQGAAVAPEDALPLFRRGGRQWSQDEGLALFLTVDRLVPDWKPRVFAKPPATALQLLADAARDSRN